MVFQVIFFYPFLRSYFVRSSLGIQDQLCVFSTCPVDMWGIRKIPKVIAICTLPVFSDNKIFTNQNGTNNTIVTVSIIPKRRKQNRVIAKVMQNF